METETTKQVTPGKGKALVIDERVSTGEELHREVVAADGVADAIARLVREREDAQGG